MIGLIPTEQRERQLATFTSMKVGFGLVTPVMPTGHQLEMAYWQVNAQVWRGQSEDWYLSPRDFLRPEEGRVLETEEETSVK